MKLLSSIIFILFGFILIAQPANDDCSTAQPLIMHSDITNCVDWGFSEFNLASPSGVPVSSCGGSPNDDVWFTFLATGTDIIIGVDAPSVDVVHAIYSGTCGALTEIACNDFPNYSVLSGLTVGDIYYFRVYSNGNVNVPFNSEMYVCVALNVPPPVNDLCADAIDLVPSIDGVCSSSYTGTISTIPETSMPTCNPGFSAEDDVWFTFTATETQHAIDLTPTSISTPGFRCEVYTGNCGAMTLVECNTHFLTGLTIGQEYYVRVFEPSLYFGNDPFTICVTTPPPCNTSLTPPNDFCAFATPLNLLGGLCGSTLSSYTPDEMTSFCASNDGASVENNSWISFVASETSVSIQQWITGPCTINQGVQYAAFSGVCGSLVELPGCINPTNTYGQSEFLNIDNLTVGEQYYIMIDGDQGDICPFLWAAVSGVVVLGVELIEFDALLIDENEVEVTWSTINELNNSHFTVERSIDGTTWNEVSTINGAGNTNNQQIDYQIIDRINTQDGLILYYRLKQTDFDGAFSYSQVKAVKNNVQGVEVVYSSEHRVLSIFIDEELVDLEIINSIGAPILKTNFNQSIQIDSLSDGFYLIKLTTNTKDLFVKCRIY